MTTQTTTAWPEGVIARYLTVAGSSLSRDDLTVDVIDKGEDAYPVWRYEMACRACPEEFTDDSEYLIRKRAQSHAETCRAMPKP